MSDANIDQLHRMVDANESDAFVYTMFGIQLIQGVMMQRRTIWRLL